MTRLWRCRELQPHPAEQPRRLQRRVRAVHGRHRREDRPRRPSRLADQPVHPGVRHLDRQFVATRAQRRGHVDPPWRGPRDPAVDPVHTHAGEVADVAQVEDGDSRDALELDLGGVGAGSGESLRRVPEFGPRAGDRPAACARGCRAGPAATGRRAGRPPPAAGPGRRRRPAPRRRGRPSRVRPTPAGGRRRPAGSGYRRSATGSQATGARPGRPPEGRRHRPGRRIGEEDQLPVTEPPADPQQFGAGDVERRERDRAAGGPPPGRRCPARARRPRAARTAARARRRRRPGTAIPTAAVPPPPRRRPPGRRSGGAPAGSAASRYRRGTAARYRASPATSIPSSTAKRSSRASTFT